MQDLPSDNRLWRKDTGMVGRWGGAGVAVLLALAAVTAGAEEGHRLATWSDVEVRLYGRLKADASYDTSAADPGDYVRWVDPAGSDDHEFNLTANETRIGVNIKGPDAGPAKTSGKLEMDFYGNVTGADVENKARPMLRQAYVALDWPHWSLLAGQTWDIISPLSPRMLNYAPLWWAGNVGYRRPQIRVTRRFSLAEDTTLALEGGISRTVGEEMVQPESHDSDVPTGQARAAVTLPLLDDRETTVGISGHYGKEEFSVREVPTWSVSLDVLLPVTSWLTAKAEWSLGDNMDAFLGGIGQGVNTTTLRGIRSQGGWAAAEVEAGGGWSLTAGAGLSDARRKDLTAGSRGQNQCVFGNAIYSLTENAKVGLEVSRWGTQYVGTGTADDVRAQVSVIYEF